MTLHPNCKINLGLNVVAKRPDGYHNLETLFLPIPLCDELEMEEAGAFSFVQEGIALDNPPDDNLCVRAYRLMQSEFPTCVKPVRMRLHKNIPFGAGLGGGSSDAAHVLTGLRTLFSIPVEDSRLEVLASRLGADCPFFVRNRPAYATGIGDQLSPIDLNLSSYRLMLVKPHDHVSTKEAYSGIVPSPSNIDLREAVKAPVEEWKRLIKNDFERSVFPAHPAIAALKEALYAQGALYASMSGSGAALFALFPLSATPRIEAPFVWMQQVGVESRK